MADMNLTSARAGLTPQIWDNKFFTEYVRKNQFARYMGKSMGSLIQVKDSLESKSGDSVTFASARRLVGAGVTGNQILEGNEELLNLRSLKLTVGVIRHAVAVSEWDEQKSVIDLRDVARDALMTWELEKMRADIILSLGAITANADVQIAYASATAGQRNTWLVNNADRVLAGALVANTVSGVAATALLTIDNTADKLTAALVSLAKRKAKLASPRIRPITVKDDEEWFVMFVPSLPFRDLTLDASIIASRQYAAERGANNPLFTGGDIIWDGVIIREVPELGVLSGVGNGGIDVAASYLCGAQALGIAWAQRAKTTTNTRDYGFMHGVGVQEVRGIGKMRFGTDATTDQSTPVDAGIVTVFTAAVADA